MLIVQIHCIFSILQIVALILIVVAAYSRVVSIVVSLSLVSGVIASGVFLMLIAVIGYLGAIKHHQVLLFFVSYFNSNWNHLDYKV